MDENYYASPEEFEHMRQPAGLPAFVKGWCIADLVFCSLRVFLVLLGTVGLVAMGAADPLYITAFFEIVTGLGIVIFGLTGNIMLLLGKRSSIVFCWLNVASTVGSILVGVWQTAVQFGNMEGPMLAGAIIGVAIFLPLRVTLLVFYTIAISRAKSHFLSAAVNPFQQANVR